MTSLPYQSINRASDNSQTLNTSKYQKISISTLLNPSRTEGKFSIITKQSLGQISQPHHSIIFKQASNIVKNSIYFNSDLYQNANQNIYQVQNSHSGIPQQQHVIYRPKGITNIQSQVLFSNQSPQRLSSKFNNFTHSIHNYQQTRIERNPERAFNDLHDTNDQNHFYQDQKIRVARIEKHKSPDFISQPESTTYYRQQNYRSKDRKISTGSNWIQVNPTLIPRRLDDPLPHSVWIYTNQNQQFSNGKVYTNNSNSIDFRPYQEQTKETQLVETIIQRPLYQKRYNNRTQLYKDTIQLDEAPKIKKTFCAPWCWVLLGLLSLLAIALGIIFGLQLLSGSRSISGGLNMTLPSIPQTNITTPSEPNTNISIPEVPTIPNITVPLIPDINLTNPEIPSDNLTNPQSPQNNVTNPLNPLNPNITNSVNPLNPNITTSPVVIPSFNTTQPTGSGQQNPVFPIGNETQLNPSNISGQTQFQNEDQNFISAEPIPAISSWIPAEAIAPTSSYISPEPVPELTYWVATQTGSVVSWIPAEPIEQIAAFIQPVPISELYQINRVNKPEQVIPLASQSFSNLLSRDNSAQIIPISVPQQIPSRQIVDIKYSGRQDTTQKTEMNITQPETMLNQKPSNTVQNTQAN